MKKRNDQDGDDDDDDEYSESSDDDDSAPYFDEDDGETAVRIDARGFHNMQEAISFVQGQQQSFSLLKVTDYDFDEVPLIEQTLTTTKFETVHFNNGTSARGEWAVLAPALVNTQVKSLSIAFYEDYFIPTKVYTQDAEALALAIRNTSSLESCIFLSDRVLASGCLNASAIPLALKSENSLSNENLKKLGLCFCWLGLDGATALGDVLEAEDCFIEELDLRAASLTSAYLVQIMRGVKRNKRLKKLDLAKNFEMIGGVEAAESIAEMFQENNALVQMNLCDTFATGAAPVEILAAGLVGNSKLQVLKLFHERRDNNHHEDAEGRDLYKAWQTSDCSLLWRYLETNRKLVSGELGQAVNQFPVAVWPTCLALMTNRPPSMLFQFLNELDVNTLLLHTSRRRRRRPVCYSGGGKPAKVAKRCTRSGRKMNGAN